MSIARFSIGKRGSSAANAAYVTSEKSAEHISFFNLKHLEADTKFEARNNAVAYAGARQIRERKTRKDARTHYQLILSWHGREETEIAASETHDFLKKNFSKVRAILGVHQDSDNTHVHVWIDARQIDRKKLQLNKTRFRTIDEKWAEHYDERYQTKHLEDYKRKKEETKQFKQSVYYVRRDLGDAIGDIVALNKPERASDRFRKAYFRDGRAKYQTVTLLNEDPSGTGDSDSGFGTSLENKAPDPQKTIERNRTVLVEKDKNSIEQKKESKNDAVPLTMELSFEKPLKKKSELQEPEPEATDSSKQKVETISRKLKKKKTKKKKKPANNKKKSNAIENNQDRYSKAIVEKNVQDEPNHKTELPHGTNKNADIHGNILLAELEKERAHFLLKKTRFKQKSQKHELTFRRKDGSKASQKISLDDPRHQKESSIHKLYEQEDLKPSVPEGQDADKFGDLLVAEAKVSKASFLLKKAKRDEHTRKHTITEKYENDAESTQNASLEMLAAQKRTYASYKLKMASKIGAVDSDAKRNGISKSEAAKRIYSEAHKEITNQQKPWKEKILVRNNQIIENIKAITSVQL